MEEADFLSTWQLKGRGWSPTMIKQLLGEPAAVERLDRMRTRNLYLVSDVERIKAQDGFKERVEQAAARAAKGKAAARRRADEVREAVREIAGQLKVDTTDLDLDALEQYVITRQDAIDLERGRFDDGVDPDTETVRRWCRNVLRHECSTYDELLYRTRKRFKGVPGVNAVYDEIIRPQIDILVDDALKQLETDAGRGVRGGRHIRQQLQALEPEEEEETMSPEEAARRRAQRTRLRRGKLRRSWMSVAIASSRPCTEDRTRRSTS